MMTTEEKLRLYELAEEAQKNGNMEEATRIKAGIPLRPNVAKIGKEVYGAEYMKNSGLNLSAAEDVYGKDWLDK